MALSAVASSPKKRSAASTNGSAEALLRSVEPWL
jgi:hypothetical protein